VEQALYQRAVGCEVYEEKPGFDKGQHVSTARVKKQLPADPTSMIYWLKNRQPEKWRDRQQGDVPITQVLTVVSSGKKTDFDL
jgi:hypothetical protein